MLPFDQKMTNYKKENREAILFYRFTASSRLYGVDWTNIAIIIVSCLVLILNIVFHKFSFVLLYRFNHNFFYTDVTVKRLKINYWNLLDRYLWNPFYNIATLASASDLISVGLTSRHCKNFKVIFDIIKSFYSEDENDIQIKIKYPIMPNY